MKRFAFLILVFAAAAIVEGGEIIKQWAESFESDEGTVQTCMGQAETSETEIQTLEDQLTQITSIQDVDDATKKSFEKYTHFMACMLEKSEMLKDSKLVVDKIIESIEKDKDQDKFVINKEMVKECMTSLNDDSTLGQDDRVMGMTVCVLVGGEEKTKKK